MRRGWELRELVGHDLACHQQREGVGGGGLTIQAANGEAGSIRHVRDELECLNDAGFLNAAAEAVAALRP